MLVICIQLIYAIGLSDAWLGAQHPEKELHRPSVLSNTSITFATRYHSCPPAPRAEETMNCDDRPNSDSKGVAAWHIRGHTETRRLMDVMNYRIYANRMNPDPPIAARMESLMLAPSPITLRGRCVVPYGR